MTSSPVPATTTRPGTPPDSSLTTIRRQVIVNDRQEVFGYELFHGSLLEGAHTAASDAALLFNALTYSAGTETLGTDQAVFINCTHESLAGGHLDLVAPQRVVLEIPTLEDTATAEQIESRLVIFNALRKRGFRLAFDHTLLRRTYTSWLPLADFIKLDMLTLPVQSLPALVKFAQTYTRAQLVAERLESQEQFQHMKSLGVHLFQGYLFARPEAVQLHIVRPAHAHVMQLMELVRTPGNDAAIDKLFKQSPVLYFSLLRLIHASGFQLSADATSISNAIAVLGSKKLFHWAALLLATSRPTDMDPAAASQAIVRGRLMELLAADILPRHEADFAYMVGVFSLIDEILGIPPERAFSAIVLPAQVLNTLRQRQGNLALLLELAEACQSENEATFAQAARTLQLNNHQVNMAHLQALAWASHR